MLASDDSVFVFSGQVSRQFGPLERTAFAHTFVFPHTADFRRPALVEYLRPTPRKKLLRLRKSLLSSDRRARKVASKSARRRWWQNSLNEREAASVHTVSQPF